MFNSSIKNEYIENNGLNNKEYLHRIFNVIGNVEQEKGKDIYDFSREEIISAICDSVKTNNISTLYKYYYEVMKYITWSARMGYTDIVMSARLIIDDKIKSDLAKYATNNIKSNIIYNPADLSEICNKFLNINENKNELPTISDIVYAYIHLVYNNMTPNDILSLKCKDCQFTLDKKMVINCNNTVFVIYPESETMISKILIHRSYIRDGGKMVRNMNDYLIGIGDDSDPVLNSTGRDLKKVKAYLSKYINTKISRYNKDSENEKLSLSLNDIYKFGVVYRFKQNDNLSEDELRNLLAKQGVNKGAINDIINCYHIW